MKSSALVAASNLRLPAIRISMILRSAGALPSEYSNQTAKLFGVGGTDCCVIKRMARSAIVVAYSASISPIGWPTIVQSGDAFGVKAQFCPGIIVHEGTNLTLNSPEKSAANTYLMLTY